MARSVLVTRPEAECRDLAARLAAARIEVLPFPVLSQREVVDDPGWSEVTAALVDPSQPLWLVLTSARAAAAVAVLAPARAAALLALPTAAVGAATARAAEAAGLAVTVVGDTGGAELAATLLARWERPTTAVFACGRDHRPELAAALTAAGHHVLALVVYAMEPTPAAELPLPDATPDAVVLTSPRAASGYLERLGGRPLDCPHWALGNTTRDAAAELGLSCRVPPRPTLDSLTEELCQT